MWPAPGPPGCPVAVASGSWQGGLLLGSLRREHILSASVREQSLRRRLVKGARPSGGDLSRPRSLCWAQRPPISSRPVLAPAHLLICSPARWTACVIVPMGQTWKLGLRSLGVAGWPQASLSPAGSLASGSSGLGRRPEIRVTVHVFHGGVSGSTVGRVGRVAALPRMPTQSCWRRRQVEGPGCPWSGGGSQLLLPTNLLGHPPHAGLGACLP